MEKNNLENTIISPEIELKNKIFTIRGIQVMLDSDLAMIYGYTTKAFNQQIKNNIEKFDEDFMFRLTPEETEILRSKNLTSSWGGRRTPPNVFTEQGIYMLMTVLKGELATRQSKALIRIFREMKEYIIENQSIINQRDFIRLTLQTSENAAEILSIRKTLNEVDTKVENVVVTLGEMVTKSELSDILMKFGKPLIPHDWLIFNGQPVESDLAYQTIYGLAKTTIYIIDNYISLKTLILLKNIKPNVNITLFSDNLKSGLHQIEFYDFTQEFPEINIKLRQCGGAFHDRYIVIDPGTLNESIYHCGASSKDGGKRIMTISKVEDIEIYQSLLTSLKKNNPLKLP